MAKMKWDQEGQRLYETGVSQGALFVKKAGVYEAGVPWNGLIKVSESPSGAEPTPIYADNIKYLTLMSAEEFGASIEAYTYPDEFMECDGSADIAVGVTIGQQPRSPFGLVYKSVIGNDTDGAEHGYKLHIIYGALAAPSEREYNTINDSPEAMTFSWELTTTPVEVDGKKPTSTLVIDSTKVTAVQMAALEAKLYGSADTEPTLLLPDEVVNLLSSINTPQG